MPGPRTGAHLTTFLMEAKINFVVLGAGLQGSAASRGNISCNGSHDRGCTLGDPSVKDLSKNILIFPFKNIASDGL